MFRVLAFSVVFVARVTSIAGQTRPSTADFIREPITITVPPGPCAVPAAAHQIAQAIGEPAGIEYLHPAPARRARLRRTKRCRSLA